MRHIQFSEAGCPHIKLHSSTDRSMLIDIASLPNHANTLKISFTLRVLGNIRLPASCNQRQYRDRLIAIANGYAETFGFMELAARYANNLVNARFIWRNRLAADAIEVRIRRLDKGLMEHIVVDAFAYSLRQFARDPFIDTVATQISRALMSQDQASFAVEAFVRLGPTGDVFPSQEMILDRGDWRIRKRKVLYSAQGAAAIHAHKIGNAIRTIDTWYSSNDDLGPIAIEPYGTVTQYGKAYRQRSKHTDFQSLLGTWFSGHEELNSEQQHYVMANLIRGGIVGIER